VIKKELQKGRQTLPLSHINQYLIIHNFATLCIKGIGWIAASKMIAQQWHEGEGLYFARRVHALAQHYQIFESLPTEMRGGTRRSGSLLFDESVKLACMEWLTSQPSGQVTPHLFQKALNSTILPALNIALKKPLCERTARRWLVKLGWQMTLLRKGVYMDGHEREDVRKYRQDVFLPAMEQYEARMVKFEGPELISVEPTLAPGEKRIIANFHDESCFHVNDNRGRAW
jgi:hypothetical protein